MKRLPRFTAPLDAALLVACLFGTSALAQTPIPAGYAPNAASGMMAGIMGPGGSFFVENGWLFYNTKKFVDSRGNEIPTQTTSWRAGPRQKHQGRWMALPLCNP